MVNDYYDIVFIGGSAGGVAGALYARQKYPDKSILVVKKDEKSLIPCAIPYIYGELKSSDNDLISNDLYKGINVDLLIENVSYVNSKDKIIEISNGQKIKYDKLILATGSSPFIPPIENIEHMKNVYFVKKNATVVDEIASKISDAKNIVIVGGGYIGVEFAEQIKEVDNLKNITIIEGLDRLVSATFDSEFSSEIEDKLKYVGINILAKRFVSKLEGDENNNVNKVILNDGTVLDADFVLVGVGVRANIELAEKSGIKITEHKDIFVDKYQRTSERDIFAAGDCAMKYSFFSGKPSPIRLASVATKEARIAVENLYSLSWENQGVVGVYSTKVHDKVYAGCGLTEDFAKREGYDTVVGITKVVNRHPGSLKGAKEIMLKMVFDKNTQRILGAQVSGDLCVGDMINNIAGFVEAKETIKDLVFSEYATHPKVSASPVMYPLVTAALDALKKL
jgi:NADPH-dependent 2,4-dienoyl-CoA reductase/sulfur reductase-like enzyme